MLSDHTDSQVKILKWSLDDVLSTPPSVTCHSLVQKHLSTKPHRSISVKMIAITYLFNSLICVCFSSDLDAAALCSLPQ